MNGKYKHIHGSVKDKKKSKTVIARILFYINELYPSKQGCQELKHDIKENISDITPSEEDYKKLMKWKIDDEIPNFSDEFKIKRSIDHNN